MKRTRILTNFDIDSHMKQQLSVDSQEKWSLNPFLASRDIFSLVITSANSLDSDQDQQNVGPDLDPVI